MSLRITLIQGGGIGHDTVPAVLRIDNLKTGARKYTKLDHDDMEVRMYGDAAVVRATAQVATSQKGGTATAVHLRFLHVWIWKGGRLQLVAHQSLRLAN